MTYTGVATKEPASASPTLDLVEWIVTGSKNAISDKARTIGAKSVVDTIACMLGALAEPGLNILTRTIRTHPDLPSSLIGFATAAAPSDAALINGMAAHMLDLDDGDFVSRAHPSCVILPTLLALGEARRSSGKALLDAFVTGWTVMQTIGAMVVPEMPKRGYHVTSAVGVIAAAAGAAKLLSFDCKKTATAMGIAASASAGIRANFGTDMKPYHAGCAAAAAVRAVELAEAGFTASTSILEATDGLIAVLVDKVATGRVRKHVDRLLNGEVRFEDEPPNIKFFAACHCVHAQIEGALKLRSKIEDLNSIRSIIVEGGTHTALYMIHSRPVTGLEAKFSMEGATAIALVDGAGGPNQFTDISINRPEVQKLLRKADAVGLDPRLDAPDLADEEAVGRALATIVAAGKARDVDAESALAGWVRRFRERFQRMEALARARDIDLARADAGVVDALWQEA